MTPLVRPLFLAFCFTSSLCFLPGCLHNASAQQKNKYERIEIVDNSAVTTSGVCRKLAISISVDSIGLVISAGAARVFIPPLDGELPSEILLGDFWSNGLCFAAVKSYSGFVNESYDLYRLDQAAESGEAPLQVLVNPEFGGDRIISSYREGARWHGESLCFSEQAGRPYICEHRVDLNEEIQRYRSCDHFGTCSNPILSERRGIEALNATILAQRAYSYQMSEDGGLELSRSYLTEGDKVSLLDFAEHDGRLFYEFSYGEGSAETVGWVLSEAVVIDCQRDC